MAKYRTKIVEIEAEQFFDNAESLAALSDMGLTVRVSYKGEAPVLKIETLEGTMSASEGDYIIKGVQGEFYPCKPDIFEKSYERVLDNFTDNPVIPGMDGETT